MRLATAMVAAATLGAVSVPVAAAGRVLIEDSTFRATVADGMRCGGAVELDVTTRDPALLDADTGDVQRIVDAALAAIRFQCPNIPELTVRGRLQDRNVTDFVAVANGANGWRLRPNKTVQLETSPRAAAEDRSSDSSAPVVAGLAPGMSLEAARAALVSNFDAEPQLLDGERLVIEKNGCRAGIDWRHAPAMARPGWRCLQAWFTRGDNPRLYRIDFTEVVDGGWSQEATERLVDRYGEPVFRQGPTRSQAERRTVELAWGEEVVMDGNPRHELQAAVRSSTRMTILDLSLYEPVLTPARTQEEFKF